MRRQVGALALVLALAGAALVVGRAQASAPAPLAPTSAKGIAGSGPGARAPATSPQLGSNAVLFSNLGPGGSFSSTGWDVSGSASGAGRFDEAMRFTPYTSGRVTRIDIAVTNFAGPNGAFVSLAQDSGGVPGTVLGSWLIVNQPAYGSTCCATSITVSQSIPVGAGHTYWLIAAAATTTTWDAWSWNYYGDTDTFAYNQGSGWNYAFGPVGGFDLIGCSKLCKV